jgi:hypothetical protein
MRFVVTSGVDRSFEDLSMLHHYPTIVECVARECILLSYLSGSDRVFLDPHDSKATWRLLRDLALNVKLPQRREKPGKLTTITTLLRTTIRSVAALPRRISVTATSTAKTTTMARTTTTTLHVEVVVAVVVVVGE